MTARFMVGLWLVLAVAFAGCRRKPRQNLAEKLAEAAAEKAMEQSGAGKGDVQVDLSKNSMRMQSDEGELEVTSGADAKLPKSFPKDVPIYRGAKIARTLSTPGGFSVALETPDSPGQVIKDVKAAMEASGWNRTSAMEMGDTTVLTYEKEGRTISVMTVQSDDVTQITLSGANQG